MPTCCEAPVIHFLSKPLGLVSTGIPAIVIVHIIIRSRHVLTSMVTNLVKIYCGQAESQSKMFLPLLPVPLKIFLILLAQEGLKCQQRALECKWERKQAGGK